MSKLYLCAVVVSLSLPALAADPPAPHWLTWYGELLPLVEASGTIVVELSPTSRLDATTIARDVRARLVRELAPQKRRLLVLDVSALSAAGRGTARARGWEPVWC